MVHCAYLDVFGYKAYDQVQMRIAIAAVRVPYLILWAVFQLHQDPSRSGELKASGPLNRRLLK